MTINNKKGFNNPQFKSMHAEYKLPDIWQNSVNMEAISICINLVIKELNNNNLTIRDSIYTLKLCEEIILETSTTANKKIEIYSQGENIYWSIQEND